LLDRDKVVTELQELDPLLRQGPTLMVHACEGARGPLSSPCTAQSQATNERLLVDDIVPHA
jgi:hypothetical protein